MINFKITSRLTMILGLTIILFYLDICFLDIIMKNNEEWELFLKDFIIINLDFIILFIYNYFNEKNNYYFTLTIILTSFLISNYWFFYIQLLVIIPFSKYLAKELKINIKNNWK